MLVGNLLFAIAQLLQVVLNIYWWIVIISALLTWVNPDPYNPIVRFLRSVTDPVYYYVRRYLPFVYVGGFDLSPIVVLLGITFIQAFAVQSIFDLAVTMR
jgi:YggT family protein